MKRKLREVTRRIRAATQRFDIDATMEKKFAALLITETRGWDSLSPWQRVEVSLGRADSAPGEIRVSLLTRSMSSHLPYTQLAVMASEVDTVYFLVFHLGDDD